MFSGGNHDRRASLALRLILGILTAGLALAFGLRGTLLGSPSQEIKGSIFYVWFAHYEIGILAALIPLVFLTAWHGNKISSPIVLPPCPRDTRIIGLFALVVFLVSVAGHFFVYARFPFSMDEYNVIFQSKLFLAGHLWAPVPEAALPIEKYVRPIFVAYLESKKAWMSFYQPGYTLLYSLGDRMGSAWILNPLLGSGSILLAARCAKHLLPDCPRAPLVAALILAGSNQVLFYGMGFYSMQAHLFFNLLWLLLWMKNVPWSHVLAGVLGAYAVHLHQPQVHTLFVLPFLLSLVISRRWKLTWWYALIYGLSALFFLYWLGLKTDGMEKGLVQTAGFFRWWPGQLLIQPMNLVLFICWNTPALVFFLCFLPTSTWKHPVLAPLAAGVLLTFLFYFFFPSNQGHGWGYRYAHAILGNVCLLGVAGYATCARVDPSLSLRLLWLSTTIALVIQLPMHAIGAHQLIAPFARADAWLKTLDADLVILPVKEVWYAQDLMRNDPLPPLGPLRAHNLDHADLEQKLAPNVKRIEITPKDLLRLGIPSSVTADQE